MRRVAILLALLVAALGGAGCGGSTDGDGTSTPQLVVSAAASLQAAFTQYGTRFTDAKARFSFAGSDVLAGQIRAGVRPDVYASANTTLPDALYVQGLVDKPIRFASNELVLATQADDKQINSLEDVEKQGVRLAVGAASVPVGGYTLNTLAKLPRAKARAILANVRSAEPDVTGIVGKLVQGAVDAGFLYATDVLATNGKLRAIHLPSQLTPVVQYGVAIVNGARHPAQAKAFIYGLLSGAGRDALARNGFGQPPPV
jgi:molybdate transport system substrate-binding protein